MGTNLRDGNIDKMEILSVSLNLPSIAANTTANASFTVSGLRLGDVVFVNKPSTSAGLGIVGSYVSANDQLSLSVANVTGSPIDLTAQTYLILVCRPEDVATIPSAFPA